MAKREGTSRASSVSTGIALALTAFALSMFLFFDRQYFGSYSGTMAVALVVIGFAALGTELESLSEEGQQSTMGQAKASGVFSNIGIGLALLIAWAALYSSVSTTWGNILLFPILLFAIFGTMLGFVNLLLSATPVGSDIQDNHPSSNAVAQAQNRVNRPWSLALRIAVAISGILGFIASVLQILQFLKIVQ